MVQFHVLGPLEAVRDGEPISLGAPKQRALLTALLMRPGVVVSVERLIDEVWGESAPRTAQHSIQLYVSELRKLLDGDDEEVIVTRSPGYLLRVGLDSIDATVFEGLLTEGMALLPRDPRAAMLLLERAVGMWRGPAFADFAYDDFVQSEARRLESLKLDAEDALDEARMRVGEDQGSTARLQKRVEGHPLRERTRGLYMEALARAGRQADALRTMHDLRSRLAVELGIEPSPELCRLEERILLQDPVVTPPLWSTEGPVVRNPYKGLWAFQEADRADFHGRDRLVERLVQVVENVPFTAVVGPSGSGKSSLVRAGLIPILREHRLVPALMVPGASPLVALQTIVGEVCESQDVGVVSHPGWLAETVGQGAIPPESLVLVVDQFEELYTLADPDEARLFIECLLDACAQPAGMKVAVALRADYYDRPLSDPEFGQLFVSNVVNVSPMSAAEYEAATVAPAQAVGLSVEPSLLARIVTDVSGQPGALPLFQFALTELVDDCDERTLTLEAYEAMGGLSGVVLGRAEHAYLELDGAGREAARQLTLRLTGIDERSTPTRRRVTASELSDLNVDPLALRSALESLGTHRLLTFDRDPDGSPTVEFAHDTLLKSWERLAGWIEDGRNDLRRKAALALAVAEWEESGRDSDYLPSGNQLEFYEAWRQTSTMRLTTTEQTFLDSAMARAAALKSELVARREAERRLQRRARTRLWIAATLAVLLVAAGVVAFVVTRPEGPRIALVHEGRGDVAFRDLVAQGWDRVNREVTFRGEEVIPLAGVVDEMESLVDSGYELIISIGATLTQQEAVPSVAANHPDVMFAVVDAIVDAPNVTSIVFESGAGSFLAGAAAALVSETGTVGFVGGFQVPLIEEFRAGFEAGARYVDPEVEVLATFVTESVEVFQAFGRPDLGYLAAENLYLAGADVVFHAAGTSGNGVIEAASTISVDPPVHLWAIGVDTDQYLLAAAEVRPHILTSVIKRVDVAVERAVAEFVAGELAPGLRVLGIADGAISLSMSGNHLMAHQADLASIEAMILDGTIEVPSEPSGPVLPAPVPEADLSVTITYRDGVCEYDGPGAIAAGSTVELIGINVSAEGAFIGFVPLTEHVDIEELEAADEVPPELLISQAMGALVDPGDQGSAFAQRLAARSYAVFCTGEAPHPAAVVTVE